MDISRTPLFITQSPKPYPHVFEELLHRSPFAWVFKTSSAITSFWKLNNRGPCRNPVRCGRRLVEVSVVRWKVEIDIVTSVFLN
jgi:hypothetical protein